MDYLPVEASLTLAFTIYLYRKFASKEVKLYVSILVVLVWFLTFLKVFIVPIDIYLSAIENNNTTEVQSEELSEISKSKEQINFLWQFLYWTIYVLSWIIIPIAQEYEAAGDFTISMKLKRSLKRNAFFYIILGFVSGVFILFLVLRQKFTMYFI